MESKIKKDEAPIKPTPQGNLETPEADDEFCYSIPAQNLTDVLQIFEDLRSKKPLDTSKNLSESLHILFEYEEEMINYIENKSNLNSLSKEILRVLTYENLSQLIDNRTLFKIANIKSAIRSCFDALLNEIYKDKTTLKNSFAFLSDLTLNEEERVSAIESQINSLHEKFYLEFYEKCYEKLEVNIIPNYMIKGYWEKLNAFLLDNVSKECLHGYYEQFKAEQPEVKQMNFYLKNLLKRNVALFDKMPNSYFNQELVETLFKILVISNLDYLGKDPIANQIFISKLNKYAIIMDIKLADAKNFYEFYKSIFISLKNNYKNNRNKNTIKVNQNVNLKINNNNNENENQRIIIDHVAIDNNKNENTEESEFSFDSELKSLFTEVRESLKRPEIYYMIVFSFSLMLNDFVLVDFGEVVINPSISVNARERQFLLNFLKKLNEHIKDSNLQDKKHKNFPFYLNSIVESFIAKKLLKDENIPIFGLDLDDKKIEIDHKIMIDSILGLNENRVVNVNNSNDNRNNNFGSERMNLISQQLDKPVKARRSILSHNSELSNKATALLSSDSNNEFDFKEKREGKGKGKENEINNNIDNEYSDSNLATSYSNQNTLIEIIEKDQTKTDNKFNSNLKTHIENENETGNNNITNPYAEENNNNYDFLNENQINFEVDCEDCEDSEDSEAAAALSRRILEKYEKIKPHLLESSSTINKVFSLLNSFLSIGFGGGVSNEVADAKLELQKIKIRPLNNYIFSLNTSIFFSGFLSEGSDHYNAWKFFKFSLDENKEMHSFEWPALSYHDVGNQAIHLLGKVSRIYMNFRNRNFPGLFDELINIKRLRDNNIFHKAVKIAKLSGKILAFAIAKRKIFRLHSINLIGFSLGCQVIKSFLKELFELAQNEKNEELNQDLVNIVQNVVFIGGSVDFKKKRKWAKIFNTLVAGKVVNIHCDNDLILKQLYKAAKPLNDPIGIRRLLIEGCDKIENYDVTSKNDGHLSYRSMLDHIMMEVDLDL